MIDPYSIQATYSRNLARDASADAAWTGIVNARLGLPIPFPRMIESRPSTLFAAVPARSEPHFNT